MLSPLDCYELCVQSPRHIVAMLRAIHAGIAQSGAGAAQSGGPVVLREDFCGTAAVGRRWCESPDASAIAIDLDPHAIAWAQSRAVESGVADRLSLHLGDATVKDAPASHEPCDAVFVGNFSIGYIHRRADLMRYLRHSLDRLKRGLMGPGIFACDTYGGAGALRLGETRRKHPGKGHELIHYLWRHEEADPITAMVTNSISFEVESTLTGQVEARLPRAFVYRWRLWSIAELRECLLEVGFSRVEVYKDGNLAPGEPAQAVTDPRELGEDWAVLIAAAA